MLDGLFEIVGVCDGVCVGVSDAEGSGGGGGGDSGVELVPPILLSSTIINYYFLHKYYKSFIKTISIDITYQIQIHSVAPSRGALAGWEHLRPCI